MLMLISSIETQSCFHINFTSVPIFSIERINIKGVNGTGTNLKRITSPMLIPKKYKINLPINFKILRIILHKKRDVNIRSEEHTSELQSRENLVCRLLLEKKKK